MNENRRRFQGGYIVGPVSDESQRIREDKVIQSLYDGLRRLEIGIDNKDKRDYYTIYNILMEKGGYGEEIAQYMMKNLVKKTPPKKTQDEEQSL